MSIKELREVKSLEELKQRKELHKSANELIGALIGLAALIIIFSIIAIGTAGNEKIEGSKAIDSAVTAYGYTGPYDGYSHGVTVVLGEEAKGAQVSFGEKEGKCNKSRLDYKDVGQHTIYYEVKKYGCKTVKGSARIVIRPCPLTSENIVMRKGDKLKYNGNLQTIDFDVYANGMELELGKDYEVSPNCDSFKQKSSGEYTVKIIGTGNYYGYASQKWSITKGKLPEFKRGSYSGEYDGTYHTAAIIFPEGSTAKATYGATLSTINQAEPVGFKDIGVHVCRATVSQDGYDSVTVATLVTIGEREAIINVDPVDKFIGDNDPEYTYKVVGLVGGDTLKGISLSRKQGEEIGKYDITARELQPGISNPNYNVGVTTAKLTIRMAESQRSEGSKLLRGAVPLTIVSILSIVSVGWAIKRIRRHSRRRRGL